MNYFQDFLSKKYQLIFIFKSHINLGISWPLDKPT